MICDACERMFQHARPEGEFYTSGIHHHDITSITSAAASGCYVCEPLLSDIPKILTPLEFKTTYTMREYYMYIQILSSDGWPKAGKGYGIIPNPDMVSDCTMRGRTPCVAMSNGIKTAQMWMQKCSAGHQQCQHNQSPSPYPTRLLELKGSALFLITTKETEISGPYAALSYCWGPNPSFLQLTSSNAQQIEAGILYTDLPIAFQEAIQLAIGLDIRYIWIDCLCIIQAGPDHKQDWSSESSKMQDVYSNCTVNISLARATNPYESCLDAIGADTSMPFKTDRHWSWDRSKTGSRTCIVIPTTYYEHNLYDLPLGQRAWVLQERIMAPRVISFGLGELFWECPQRPDASESFPNGLEGTDYPASNRKQDISISRYVPELQRIWRSLLHEYTKRRLTQPKTDKLVAISAVSTRLEKAMNDKYIKGHFLNMLPMSLLWKPEGNADRLQNGVPSWSWASMDGPLMQPLHTGTKPIANVVSYHLEHTKKKDSEEVSLTIEAFCDRMEWNQHSHHSVEDFGIGTYIKYTNFVWDISTDDCDNETREYLAAFIGMGIFGFNGLMLRESEKEQPQKYERVGLFSLEPDLEALLEARKKRIFECDSDEEVDMFLAVLELQGKRTLVLV